MIHTPTPWRTHETQDMIAIFDKEGNQVATLSFSRLYEQRYFNAQRIVECVNACEGIDTPQQFIEFAKKHLTNDFRHAGFLMEMKSQIEQLKEHRQELINAIDCISKTNNSDGYHYRLAKELLEKYNKLTL